MGLLQREVESILFQPIPILAVIWLDHAHLVPKGFAVVAMFEMRQFVDDDIFDHIQRRHRQPVSEIEVVLS